MPKPFAVEVGQHDQQPECPPVAKALCHEVIDQVRLGASGTASASGLSRVNHLRGFSADSVAARSRSA